MSLSVQMTQCISGVEESLTPIEGEEIQNQQTSFFNTQEARGSLQTSQKTYTFKSNPANENTPKFHQYVNPKKGEKAKHSPMDLASQTYGSHRGAQSEANRNPKTFSQLPKTSQPQQKNSFSSAQIKSASQPTNPTQSSQAHGKQALKSHSSAVDAKRTPEKSPSQSKERLKNTDSQKMNQLSTRQWEKRETRDWWEQRYHQKEREEQRHGQDQRQGQEEAKENKKKKQIVETLAAASTAKSPSSSQQYRVGGASLELKKPVLERPKTGVFALYYILTKIGIISDSSSNYSYKKEIELVDDETSTAHKKRLDEIKEALNKEHSSTRWSTANKIFSWIGSMMGIITGAALIVTGVGAIAGALMIAGGLIQITNQILELTGGWHKIAEILPGNDPEKKRAVITWMQIGISILCLILSGFGVVTAGFTTVSSAMQIASQLFDAIRLVGQGTTSIGKGITLFMFKNKMSESRKYDKILADLKHKRTDLMEKVEWGIDRLEQLFKDLAQTLEFEEELFRADQMVNR